MRQKRTAQFSNPTHHRVERRKTGISARQQRKRLKHERRVQIKKEAAS